MATFSKLRSSDANLASFAASYATYRPLIQRGLTVGFVLYVLASTYRSLSARPSNSSNTSGDRSSGKRGKGKGKKGGDGKSARVAVSVINHLLPTFYSVWYFGLNYYNQVDAVFYQRLGTVMRIVIPSLRSKEAMLLVMHSSLLIFRTAISLYVAALDGK